ncbi:MAG TPA: hypothetical protein VJT13_24865 [Xanthobacteraceae bacterium]|nr:hypothetical protein [Xanthobacteraceae bacterium]
MSAFDQRQYRQMLYRLEDIERGAFSIATTDLMVLLDVLEESDPVWRSEFGDGLSKLHVDISLAAARTESEGTPNLSFDPKTRARMLATAARMKQMVLAKIEGPVDDAQDAD